MHMYMHTHMHMHTGVSIAARTSTRLLSRLVPHVLRKTHRKVFGEKQFGPRVLLRKYEAAR